MLDDSLVREIYRSEAERNRVRGREVASYEGKVRKYVGEGTQEGVKGMKQSSKLCWMGKPGNFSVLTIPRMGSLRGTRCQI